MSFPKTYLRFENLYTLLTLSITHTVLQVYNKYKFFLLLPIKLQADKVETAQWWHHLYFAISNKYMPPFSKSLKLCPEVFF